jgi:two-component system, OmpR family, KDP operon response regulator KdpE
VPGHFGHHILVVEDDPIVSEILRVTLESSGYTCETATTAASALDRFKTSRPDAIITDLGLPDRDGIELVSALRGLSRIPVLVLSGRAQEADKIAALDQGADDFIEKPFLPGELVARVRAKLRQARILQPQEADPYHIDAATEASLSRMERALLAILVQHRGATISEEKLIASLWGPYRQATSGDLRSLVLKLRRKLQQQLHPLFVLNERGVGYRVSGFGRFPMRPSGATVVDEGTARPGAADRPNEDSDSVGGIASFRR